MRGKVRKRRKLLMRYEKKKVVKADEENLCLLMKSSVKRETQEEREKEMIGHDEPFQGNWLVKNPRKAAACLSTPYDPERPRLCCV